MLLASVRRARSLTWMDVWLCVRARADSLFPAIDVDTVKLQQCRRVVLFRRDPETGEFDLRHYVVNVKAAGLSKVGAKLRRTARL